MPENLIEVIRSRFSYVENGDLIWNALPGNTPEELCHNKKRAGKVAGGTNKKGYKFIVICGKRIMAHKVVYAYHCGVIPGEVDHINGVRGDNRIENLRAVSHDENMKNARQRHDNTSGTTGVSWITRDRKWRATIGHKGKLVLIGYFKDKSEAIKKRKEAESRFGYHENHGKPPAFGVDVRIW